MMTTDTIVELIMIIRHIFAQMKKPPKTCWESRGSRLENQGEMIKGDNEMPNDEDNKHATDLAS